MISMFLISKGRLTDTFYTRKLAPSFLIASFLIVGISSCSLINKRDQDISKIAKSITLRIEGATQGSGVLVKREGSLYTGLSSWHLLSQQAYGEEVIVITEDGGRHQINQKSITQLGNVDIGIFKFESSSNHKIASIGETNKTISGDTVYISGFPLASTAVPIRHWRFSNGKVLANSKVSVNGGYQILYSNATWKGMSGGMEYTCR